MSTDNPITDGCIDPRDAVTVGGVDFIVKTQSRFSRHVHLPDTDTDGSVVFDDNDNPATKCGIEHGSGDMPRKLVPLHTVENRTPCARCFADDETRSKRAAVGAGNASWARRQRFGDDWGDD